jgi:DNA-binding LacI/PurR family transcriptional regulator
VFSGLSQRGIPSTILPNPKLPVMSTVPGGIVVWPGQQRFSAVVYVSGAPDPVLVSLVQAGVVVMSLDCVSEVAGVDSVAVDCESEAATAAGFLARLGHTAIAFLAPRYTTLVRHWSDGVDPDALRFGRALLKAKERLGLSTSGAYHQLYPMDAALSDTPIRLAVDRLWRLDPAPTAVVCFDAVTGTHVREALQERGLRCPADVSIMVRDCLTREAPAFTSLAANPHQIGLAAAAQLHDRLANSSSIPANLQLPSILIEGTTSGPARHTRFHPSSWAGHCRS